MKIKTPSPAAGQLRATATNDSASAGAVGEYLESEILAGAAVALTTATPANITSLSLTAGDWDVWGEASFTLNAATTVTAINGWVSTTSATLPTAPNKGAMVTLTATLTTGATQCAPVGMRRISLAATTTVYLSAQASFAVNTMAAYGMLCARRAR